jgi:hypothetical protein
MDEYLAEEYRQFADDIRTAFTKIIESIWEEVRPVVRDFYEGGLRPHENAQDVGGWLPL